MCYTIILKRCKQILKILEEIKYYCGRDIMYTKYQ